MKKLRPNHQRVRYFVILRGFSPEESLNESLVAKRDSSPVSQAQNDKLTTFTRKPTEILHPLQGFRMTK
ncbi:hypothetical protein [Helicobacter marmotae]|uniref:hypothetical protein n=1 Tax=Helicobacter marmotae TaxID=152490 RepID=UPI0014742D55|nr:hypothetical protein [Helicobacter marmotae]